MGKFAAIAVTIIAILYGIAVSIITAAGLIWTLNTAFGLSLEMNLTTYVAITAFIMVVHRIGDGTK